MSIGQFKTVFGQSQTVLHDRDTDREKEKDRDKVATVGEAAARHGAEKRRRTGNDRDSEDQAMRAAMTDQTTEQNTTETLAKRERVRQLLIRPLESDGLVRDRRTKASEHAAFLDKLADRLGYLTDQNLETLRRYVRAQALGPAHNVWPSWATILNHAGDLQTPPDPENPIMQSWLHSVQGEALMGRGEHVETYLFLKGLVARGRSRPPRDAEKRMIAELARENRRKRELVSEAIAAGRHVSEDDRKWLAWYDEMTRTAEDIVRAGIAHRRGHGAAA